MNGRTLGGQALALAIGTCGGFAATALGMPLPWMLGAMIAVMAAALAGAPLAPPVLLRTITIPVLGVFLGAGFYPGMFDAAAGWIITLLALPLYIATAFFIGRLVYTKIGGYDPVTAYFSGAPGGLTDMMLIGTAAGGVERKIALAHASRIFIVVVVVALFYGVFFDVRATGDARPYINISDLSAFDLLILAACALVGALVAPKLGLPAPHILGPMILSGTVHLTGMTDAPPPSLAVNIAQLVLGTVIGCRFAGVLPSEIMHDLGLAVLSSGSMLVVALVSALLVATATGSAPSQVFLAFSPGGLAEMGLLALALDADVAYVAAMHIARITLVIALAPLVFRRLARG